MPKTREQLIQRVAEYIVNSEFDTIDQAAEALVDLILDELNITLAPVIGEAK